MAAEPLLQVSRLTLRHHNVRLLESISFALSFGGAHALIGESGSGKSLTALALIGLLPDSIAAESGVVSFANHANLLRLNTAERQLLRGDEIGMIFQEPMTALNPVMRLDRQLDEVLSLHTSLGARARRQRGLELLELCQLTPGRDYAERYPHQLSGGERQRAMIAAALGAGPRLLIADEPTTALDWRSAGEILALLRSLRKSEGLALLLISHDIGVVAENATTLSVLYAGEVVESGRVDQILAQPCHPYTTALLHARPELHPPRQPLPTIAGSVPSADHYPELPSCRFAPRCDRRNDGCFADLAGPPVVVSLADQQRAQSRCSRGERPQSARYAP